MNILHVTLSFSRGGRRQAISSLCRGLAAHDVASHLCCLDDYASNADERAALFAGSINLQRRRLFDFAALRKLRRYCSKHRIDLLHAHDAASEATCALALPFSRVPLLMSFHRTRNFESARFRDRLRNAIAGLRTAAIVTASQARKQHYIESNKIDPRKVICIPLGVDLVRFHPAPQRRTALRDELGAGQDVQLIGVAGHFGYEKGVDIAIDAFQYLCRRYPRMQAELVVLGDGTPQQVRSVHEHIAPEFAARIHLVGYQTQPQKWFQGFDVFLHAARDEAFGLVLAEAMACGVPVVAPAVGGIPDIIIDGQCGRLVATAEAAPLAEAVATLLHEPAIRTRMAAAASARAQQAFSVDEYARQTHRLYQTVLHGMPLQQFGLVQDYGPAEVRN